jgi:hypothetical protein
MNRPIDKDKLDDLAQEYLHLIDAKKGIDQLLKDVKEKIATHPSTPAPGAEVHFSGKRYDFVVKKAARYKWDEDMVEAAANNDDAINAIVKHKVTVDTKKLDSLPTKSLTHLLGYADITDGMITVKVTKKEESE